MTIAGEYLRIAVRLHSLPSLSSATPRRTSSSFSSSLVHLSRHPVLIRSPAPTVIVLCIGIARVRITYLNVLPVFSMTILVSQ